MIEIMYAASWLARRRFYSFSHRLYKGETLWREPALWGGRRLMSRAANELLRSPHAFLLAVENGKTLARVLTGQVGQRGYFALFDAVDRLDAVRLLMDAAANWQRAHGSRKLVGPVAPTLLDLGSGVLRQGFDRSAAFGDAYNAPYYGDYLERCGFEVDSEWLAYRVDLARFDRVKYRKISEWSSARFGYRVNHALSRRPRELAKALWEVMEGEIDQETANRLTARIHSWLDDGTCPVVTVNSEPVGILMTLVERGFAPRIATMWVKKAWRRKGVTAVLFDAFVRTADRNGWAEIDSSMVRADNLASQLSIESAGGRRVHRYCWYGKEI